MISRPSDNKKKAFSLEELERHRLALKLPPATIRKIKTRATEQGFTLSGYIVHLVIADGVDVAPLVNGGGS